MIKMTNDKLGKNNSENNALLNEYKGNLFEYLVASGVAKSWGIEKSFIQSFGGEAKERLNFYQNELLVVDSSMYMELAKSANTVADRIAQTLKKENIHNILVIGKSAGGSHDESFAECDIMLLGEERNVPISLKICKKGAFVNTKSAGIRSFVKKYFGQFSSADSKQSELNEFLDVSFEDMGRSMYEHRGLSEFDQFGNQWQESDLPGKLPSDLKAILLDHYYRVSSKLYEALKTYSKEDNELFKQCLLPILGLSSQDIIQVTCFHNGDHKVNSIEIFSYSDFLHGREHCDFLQFKKETSSFELSFGEKVIQIRVKPMNVFTVSGLKVNCSLKY